MRLSSVRNRLVLPLFAVLALPIALSAQESQLFTWTGRVDREVTLSMRGRNVSSNGARAEDRGRFNVAGELPRMDGTVNVRVNRGRGDVTVVQQPTANNNFETVIRIADRSSGADVYSVTAYVTSANTRGGGWNRGNNDNGNNGNNGNNGSYDDGRGRGRDRNEPLVLHWTGLVDANAELRWQGDNVRQRTLDGAPLRGVRSTVSGSINGNMNNGRGRNVVRATISMGEGRGQVTIIQQPAPENGYMTIIRINDPQSGYGRYTFGVTVQ